MDRGKASSYAFLDAYKSRRKGNPMNLNDADLYHHQFISRLGSDIDWWCDLCGHPVTGYDYVSNDAHISRIGGDSANGYEAYHESCFDKLYGTLPK
jgi:hypothetical protein